MRTLTLLAVILLADGLPLPAQQTNASPYARWKNGPPVDPNFFPIAVWLQKPENAERYKAAGINVYVALHRGPTAEQLALLEKAGMRVICGQRRGLEHKENRTIIGWMHNDEPDNAQSLGERKGYGPPVPPEKVVVDYERMRESDPTRPVLLNLGQGVAWDNWIGRGVRRNHPEDYPLYVKGCDIASFDIYPAVHDSGEVAGKLEFVARGVQRLVGWTDGAKPVWNCIEASRISNPNVKPTPHQIRSEVWMSLIHGSRGLIYFVHQFKPTFKEASLLEDRELLDAVTGINRQVHELAPVLNSLTITNGVSVVLSKIEANVAVMMKRARNRTYLFTVNMRPEAAQATFRPPAMKDRGRVEVLGESRSIAIDDRSFSDQFDAYAVHLYRVDDK
jgi:hypothetical protein